MKIFFLLFSLLFFSAENALTSLNDVIKEISNHCSKRLLFRVIASCGLLYGAKKSYQIIYEYKKKFYIELPPYERNLLVTLKKDLQAGVDQHTAWQNLCLKGITLEYFEVYLMYDVLRFIQQKNEKKLIEIVKNPTLDRQQKEIKMLMLVENKSMIAKILAGYGESCEIVNAMTKQDLSAILSEADYQDALVLIDFMSQATLRIISVENRHHIESILFSSESIDRYIYLAISASLNEGDYDRDNFQLLINLYKHSKERGIKMLQRLPLEFIQRFLESDSNIEDKVDIIDNMPDEGIKTIFGDSHGFHYTKRLLIFFMWRLKVKISLDDSRRGRGKRAYHSDDDRDLVCNVILERLKAQNKISILFSLSDKALVEFLWQINDIHSCVCILSSLARNPIVSTIQEMKRDAKCLAGKITEDRFELLLTEMYMTSNQEENQGKIFSVTGSERPPKIIRALHEIDRSYAQAIIAKMKNG